MPADFIIVSKPVSIQFECPFCHYENDIRWRDITPPGYFREPVQKIKERPDDPYYVKQYKSGKKNQFAWAAPACPEWAKDYINSCADKRAALRAITPPGFAQAFFRANP